MATRTPVRFGGPGYVPTTPTTFYTVPGGSNIAVMHIHINKPNSTPARLTISIGTDAAATRLYSSFTITDLVTDIFCYYAATAAEILQWTSDTANALIVTISGDLCT